MTALPVLDCTDCGKCCEKQGTPPMMKEEYDSLPSYLKWNIEDHNERYDYSLPCLWFDEVKKQCRHYNHRPQVCKDFEVGGEFCISMREN